MSDVLAQPQTVHVARPTASRDLTRSRHEVSAFLPLLLMGAALLAWSAFQCYQLLKDHRGLEQVFAAQQPQVDRSAGMRASLSTLASDTQKLADAGDAGAQVIIGQLRKRGITIHPDAAASSAP